MFLHSLKVLFASFIIQFRRKRLLYSDFFFSVFKWNVLIYCSYVVTSHDSFRYKIGDLLFLFIHQSNEFDGLDLRGRLNSIVFQWKNLHFLILISLYCEIIFNLSSKKTNFFTAPLPIVHGRL